MFFLCDCHQFLSFSSATILRVSLRYTVIPNKLVSELSSNRSGGLAIAKFEVEKFDGQNSFSLWRIKMKALLRQQGLSKVLEVSISEDSPAPSKEEEEKVHSAILLSLSDGVLREVADEETATGL